MSLGACGADTSGPGEWDDTCYNCQSVCDGTTEIALDECLVKCVECQGYSDCFGWMDGHYSGMSLLMRDWMIIACEDLR
ncbi:MAG: hypothetical protein JRJ87_11245 [Deltaproteobacteria bacterium]|nr:hypothetical protein [Deltaproteobacteria bacterium]